MSNALPRFALDERANSYEAVSYGPAWNGWATPVVTRATFEKLIADEDPKGEYFSVDFDDAGIARMTERGGCGEEYHYIITPKDGLYNLDEMGWCFDTVDCDTNQPAGMAHWKAPVETSEMPASIARGLGFLS